jgi:hypothetical protein
MKINPIGHQITLSRLATRHKERRTKEQDDDPWNRAYGRYLIDPPPGEERSDWHFEEDDQ